MTLPELSIKRHVFAWMMSGVLVLFGVISYQRIGVDRLPYVEFPVISVTTIQKGANPDVVDSSITNLIETSVNSVPGIEHIQSTSSPGTSAINITFSLEKRIDVAFNEVQAKVNQVLRRLPRDADPPIVAKVETNANPIIWMALQGDRTQQQLNQYAINVIKKKLETIDGVGEVRLGGRRDRTIRVNLLPSRMASFGVTSQDITDAFNREHLQLAGGFMVGSATESLVKLDLEFHRLDELARMIVGYKDGYSVRLSDVAEFEDGLSDKRQLARFNGNTTIGMGAVKIANTNTVAIVDQILKRLNEEIIPQLEPGMTISVVSNDALFINEIINALKEHLLEGTLLAAAVVWLFLRSVRSTLIIALAIPVSLLGAIAVMYFFGYTFNSITMLALLLLIGVVVDDSIVVLENIFRHREEIDPDPVSAAVNGSREVVFAVLAATLSLVCIFAPVVFIGGFIGQLFRSFAVVVTFGVLMSMFVSMTLTPMLCSRYLKVEKQHGRIYHLLDGFFDRIDHGYAYLLGHALARRWSVVAITILIVGSSYFFFANVGRTLSPDQDEGRFFVRIRTPLGSSIDYTETKLREIESILLPHKEIVTEFAVIGLGAVQQVNQGQVVARMAPREQRKRSQQEVIASLREELQQISGARIFIEPFPLIQGQRAALQFVLTGPSLQEVATLGPTLQQRFSEEPGIGRVDMDLDLNLPQLTLLPDRARAAALGISTLDIANALNMLTGGIDIAKFNDDPGDGQRYDIRVKAKDGEFIQAADLRKIFLRTRDSRELVRLDSVTNYRESLGPAVIGRFDLQYAATFYATPSLPLGDAVTKIREVTGDLLPLGYSLKFTGQAEELARTLPYMAFAFGMALIMLYMVLASQFNSFLQPAIVMLAQPLAIIGGVAALWVFNQTINLYSLIGLVLLIGLVAKNSILLVDLTNQRRQQGMHVDDALRDACPTRMRPVVMTSMTIILALFPAALGLGAGSETNGPLSIAVIGGMFTSTLLTLVVVPSVYSLVEGWRERKHIGASTVQPVTAPRSGTAQAEEKS
jgi:HAE1 family hydrophobic/amphiphilic exporter-1